MEARMDQREAALVITSPPGLGPEAAEAIGSRTTRGVIIELVVSAKQSLFLASPFVLLGNQTVDGILGQSLEAAVARGVGFSVVSTVAGIEAFSPHYS